MNRKERFAKEFEEDWFLDGLSQLPIRLRTAFSAASSERQYDLYEQWATSNSQVTHTDEVRKILDTLWLCILDDVQVPVDELNGYAERLADGSLGPIADNPVDIASGSVYAENCVASIAYTCLSLTEDKPLNAMWAGRREGETIDFYIEHEYGITMEEKDEQQYARRLDVTMSYLALRRKDLSELLAVREQSTGDQRKIIEVIRQRSVQTRLIFSSHD